MIPFNNEALFAALRMFRQRAISKSKAPDRAIFIYDINDSAEVEGPESEMPEQDGHYVSGFKSHVRPAQPNAREVKHCPFAHRFTGLCKCL